MEDITNRFKGYNDEQISIALQSGKKYNQI